MGPRRVPRGKRRRARMDQIGGVLLGVSGIPLAMSFVSWQFALVGIVLSLTGGVLIFLAQRPVADNAGEPKE